MRKHYLFSFILLNLLCFAMHAHQAHAAMSYVGGASANCDVATCSVSYAPTAGDLVITDAYTNGTTLSTTTDNGTGGSTTYSQAFNSGIEGNVYQAEYYTCDVKSGVTSITGNFAASDPNTVIVTEYSGNATSNCLDQVSALKTGTSESPTGGTITPTAGLNEVLNGFFLQSSNETTAFVSSTPWVVKINQADVFEGTFTGVTSQIVTPTTGSYAATASTTASVNWSGFTTSYQAAAAVAAPPTEYWFNGIIKLIGTFIFQ